MPYDVKKSQKYVARELRKKGFSYGEIQKELAVPKSTLSLWLKKIKLDEVHRKRLIEKQKEIARANGKLRIATVEERNKKIQELAMRDIKKISQHELWLMGIVLYWKENMRFEKESILRKGVTFTSADPALLKLFLVWLKKIGGLENSEISFSIYKKHITARSAGDTIDSYQKQEQEEQGKGKTEVLQKWREGEQEQARVVQYWSRVIGFPKHYFLHYYIQRATEKGDKENNTNITIRYPQDHCESQFFIGTAN